MTDYVKTQTIRLPGDKKEEEEEEERELECKIPDNLQTIRAHVEDLIKISQCVKYDQLPKMYVNPELTN